MSLIQTSVSLKTAQLKAVYRMLAFNEDADTFDEDYQLPPAGSSHNQWKILIYDTACRSIISPLLSVSQLRRRGVTLHLLLHSDREPIPDVPAVYFCRPTKENLAIIAQDCAKGLYGKAHLNFVTKLDRGLMEDFAKLVVQTGSLDSIAGVHDQYLDFVCLEQQLFSLSKKDSYVLYNGSGVSEQMIESAMTEIAYGLFSQVATLGKVPIIRCPRGGAPEMVARKLNKMIVEHPTLLRNKSSLHRPLLVILDRNADLITPIQHTSTYQALVDDMLKHKANRVEFEVANDAGGGRGKPIVKKFDLDPDEDEFYSKHKFNPFPEAIESNGVDLQQVSVKEQQIRSKATGQATMDPMGGSSATDLASAVDSLPALLAHKKQLEMHTSILQAVMNQVAARDVPQFYELEISMATGSYRSDPGRAKSNSLELLSDPTKGNVEDKLRLLVVFILTTNAKTADVDELTAAVQQAMNTTADDGKPRLDKEGRVKLESGLKAIAYLKQLRAMHMLPTANTFSELESSTDPQNNKSDMLSSFMAKATTQASGLLAKAADRVTSMLGKTHKQYATRVVENLCEMKPQTEDDDYLYLDPRVKGDVDVAKLRLMNRAPIREVTAFIVGGGCYSEYQNLQLVASERRTISYGSTELVDAGEFLAQLGQLG